MSTTYTARWLFPVTEPPLERGTITIERESILSVEPQGVRVPDIDLGNVALLPGLANAHTHLDLSGARGLFPPIPDPARATEWLEQVIAYRRTRTATYIQDDIRAGLAEAMKFGTTIIGDISAGGASYDQLAAAPIRGVCFYEVLGISPERIAAMEAAFVTWYCEDNQHSGIRKGISPHAPYSTGRRLYQLADRMEDVVSVTTHVAEFPAEREFLEKGSGPFVPFLNRVGIHEFPDLLTSPEEALCLPQMANRRRLFVHGNDLAPSAATLFRKADYLVVCPRTHAAFGHARHPFEELYAHGVKVTLGTDSLSSNPDLDPLAEARYLFQNHRALDEEFLLRSITSTGALALGWRPRAGSLTPHWSADFVTIPLPEQTGEPYHLLLGTGDHGERRTMYRGQWR